MFALNNLKIYKMMKPIYYSSLLFIVVLFSCTKDEIVEESSNTNPSISVSKPYEDFTTKLGGWLPLEGVAIDQESVKSVHYEITSPNASYNYVSTNSLDVSGTYTDFNKGIDIPEGASVGEALLNVYSEDTEGNYSSIISRKFNIIDEIAPTITILNDTIGFADIIEVQAFKNTNNVVDSLLIRNQTRSETLVIIKDKGGFKSFNFDINQKDLINNFQNSYTHQYNTSPGSTLSMSFYEYDSPTYASFVFRYY